MRIIPMLLLMFTFSHSQDKPAVSIENGFLVIKIKLDQVNFEDFSMENLKKVVNKEQLENQKYHNNIDQLMNVITLYESLLAEENRFLPDKLSKARRLLSSLKSLATTRRKNSPEFSRVTRVSDSNVFYNTEYNISRIADVDVYYNTDENVSRIGNIDVYYGTNEMITRIGEFDIY